MYSSPCHSHQGSRPATPQVSAAMDYSPSSSDAPTTRWMQVKVLYTFDHDGTTNCLTRCPQPLPIQTASLDNSSQIGVVDLKQCIRSVLASSPELVSKLDQDYAVYAVDYSEQDAPLVGQGMLSAVLTDSDATHPQDQDGNMITGRVSRNKLAIFSSNGMQETLEVKLKLSPVYTPHNAGFERLRNMSTVSTDQSDAAAWTAWVKSVRRFGPNSPVGVESMTHTSPDVLSPEDLGQTAVPYSYSSAASLAAPMTRAEGAGAFAFLPANAGHHERQVHSTTRPHSRPQSPATRAQPNAEFAQPSRPSSRASNPARPGLKSSQSCMSRMETTTAFDGAGADDGPPRKRARVEQIGWNSRTSFGQKHDSLRVVASTAASIRGERPAQRGHPTASQIAAGELPDRPPTPRAAPRMSHLSATRRASETAIAPRPRFFHAAYTADSDAGSSRPGTPIRDQSVCSSPQDMPSSPPVRTHQSPAPSSPQLPTMKDDLDSGFYSGTPDETTMDAPTPPHVQVPGNAAASSRNRPSRSRPILTSELSFTEEVPGDPRLLPKSSRQQSQRAVQSESQSFWNAESPVPSSPALPPLRNPGDNMGDMSFPDFGFQISATYGTELQSVADYLDLPENGPSPSVEPILSRESSNEQSQMSNSGRGRSQSCLADMTSRPGTPTNDTDPVAAARRLQLMNEKNEKKKRAIQARLEEAVRRGRMPTFCENCGEISTPTWRKAFVKVEQGAPDDLGTSDADGEITAIDILSTDDAGRPTSYKVIKKTLKKDESKEDCGFTEVNLCNPCGIWLIKKKEMRPPDKPNQHREPAQAPKKRDRKAEYAKRKAQKEAQQAALANPEADAVEGQPKSQPPSGRSDKSVAKTSGRTNKTKPKTTGGPRRRSTAESNVNVPDSDPFPEVARSTRPNVNIRSHSSPSAGTRSKDAVIDLDLLVPAENVKRQLFPSPKRNNGQTTSPKASSGGGGGGGDAAIFAELAAGEQAVSPSGRFTDVTFDVFMQQDKENHSPFTHDNDGNSMALVDFETLFTSPSAGLRRSPRKSTSPYKNMTFGGSSANNGAAAAKVLKTPTRSSGGRAGGGVTTTRKSSSLTPRGVLTSAAKRWLDENALNLPPTTPTRSGGGSRRLGFSSSSSPSFSSSSSAACGRAAAAAAAALTMTPFSRQLCDLLNSGEGGGMGGGGGIGLLSSSSPSFEQATEAMMMMGGADFDWGAASWAAGGAGEGDGLP